MLMILAAAAALEWTMPMFGWSNPRGAWLAIVTSMKCFVRETVVAVNGDYAIAFAHLLFQMCKPCISRRQVEFFSI